jgi:hypothetical protein
MMIVPTSAAGLDRDQSSDQTPTEEQQDQTFCPGKLLEILTQDSYLRKSGWKIIFYQFFSQAKMPKLIMKYKESKDRLEGNKNIFSRFSGSEKS